MVAQFCEGPWPASGSARERYLRNVFRGALPLRSSPCLEAPAVTRVPMGACLCAADRVVSEQGHCWLGFSLDGRVLWAIA